MGKWTIDDIDGKKIFYLELNLIQWVRMTIEKQILLNIFWKAQSNCLNQNKLELICWVFTLEKDDSASFHAKSYKLVYFYIIHTNTI